MTYDPSKFVLLQDKNAIVQEDWYYSYDGGGMTGIIPENAPVTPDMVGKPAHEASMAWQYFLVPSENHNPL